MVPKSVEFTNDKIEEGGKPQACIVTVTITNPPASEVVKFQFMVFINGRFGFMVTAGDMNWSDMSLAAKRIADANFLAGAFNHPDVFDKQFTADGQLAAFLADAKLNFDFLDAFLAVIFLSVSDVQISATSEFMRLDSSRDRISRQVSRLVSNQ